MLDAAGVGKVGMVKRTALLVCRLHMAKVRARDELGTTLCKRMARIVKKGKEDLEKSRERHRATERLRARRPGQASDRYGDTDGTPRCRSQRSP